MLDAGRSRFQHYTRRSLIGIGALVLAGGLIGCTEEEEVHYVYPSTTNPPEPGSWATGLTDELYTRLGEISVKTSFGRMGANCYQQLGLGRHPTGSCRVKVVGG